MLADQLSQHGHQVTKMTPLHIPIKNLKNPSFALFGAIQGILNTEKYDIVHAFNIPSAFAMHYSKAKKKVLSVHGMYSDQVNTLHSDTTASAARITEVKVLKWADKLTTDSKMVQQQYKEKLGVNFECIYAPLDIEKFKQLPNVTKKKNQIIFIGRDSYEKGIDILKSIGDKVNGNVIYCTNVDWKEAMTRLKESELLVIPSRMESIPQVIKEAFYLKVPIISTNVGGIPELIIHNENGYLIPPNDPTKLADAINHMLANKELKEKFGENGYNFVSKNLTWEVLLPKYVKFYEELLNS